MTLDVSSLPFDRLPARIRLSVPFAVLIIAGGFGWDYAYGSSSVLSIAGYCVCLGSATLVLSSLCLEIEETPESERKRGSKNDYHLEDEVRNSARAAVNVSASPTLRDIVGKPGQRPTQQVFDFDGIVALRALDEVTGVWLVSDASEKAATLVKAACLERVDGGESEFDRAERWFEIARGLRSRECRSLPKAELRRSFVAERIGVSKEQVRQIDQGRYAPLNKLLEEVDPKAL